MDAEVLVIYESCQRKTIKDFMERLVDIFATEVLITFFVEAIDFCDLSALVVSSNKRDFIRVLHLQCKQQCSTRKALVSSVDIVS